MFPNGRKREAALDRHKRLLHSLNRRDFAVRFRNLRSRIDLTAT